MSLGGLLSLLEPYSKMQATACAISPKPPCDRYRLDMVKYAYALEASETGKDLSWWLLTWPKSWLLETCATLITGAFRG